MITISEIQNKLKDLQVYLEEYTKPKEPTKIVDIFALIGCAEFAKKYPYIGKSTVQHYCRTIPGKCGAVVVGKKYFFDELQMLEMLKKSRTLKKRMKNMKNKFDA